MQATKKQGITVSRSRRIWLMVVLSFIFSISAAVWYWNTNKKAIIGRKIEKAIRERTDSLYDVKYDSLELDELGGRLLITDLNIFADSSRAGKSKKNPSAVILNLKIPSLLITGFKTPRAFLHDQLIARKLEIKNPVINLRYTGQKKQRGETVPVKELYELILGDLNLIDVDSVIISGAKIIAHTPKKQTVDIDDFSLFLHDVKIDSLAEQDKSRVLFSKGFQASAGSANWYSPGKHYRFNMSELKMETNPGQVLIGNFSINPSFTESQYANSSQPERIDFSCSQIKISGIDPQKLMEDELKADAVQIDKASCKVYRDQNKPARSSKQQGFYIHPVKDELSFLFDIKKLELRNSYFEYKELTKLHKSGKIDFQNINATVSNLNNKPGNQKLNALARFSF
jgi:hypothetical protein